MPLNKYTITIHALYSIYHHHSQPALKLAFPFQTEQNLYLEWSRPALVYNSVDYYYVYFRGEGSWQFEEMPLLSNVDQSGGARVSPTPSLP